MLYGLELRLINIQASNAEICSGAHAMAGTRSLRRRVVEWPGDNREIEPMPTSFREYNDDAAMLLPLDMRDWLPEDHLAYLIRDLVHNLDMTPFYRPYAGDGRRMAGRTIRR